MILYYIRHGDPIYDPDSLTPLGHRQAEAVAKRLAVHGINRIFASTSNRAILTAQPTAEILKKNVELLDFANEGHAWSDFSIADENGRGNWAFASPRFKEMFVSRQVSELDDRWYEHPEFRDCNFKNGVERVNREVDAWLGTLGYVHDRENRFYKAVAPTDERIALFAHQGFGIAFLSSILDIPYPLISTHFDIGHTGMTVINFEEQNGKVIPKALMVANDSHIYKEGLPTAYQNSIRL